MDFLFYESVILSCTLLFLQNHFVTPAEENRKRDVYKLRRLLHSRSSEDNLNPPSNDPATLVHFENLDVIVDVRGSTPVGHVVYILSTSPPDVNIYMMTRSNLFELERNKLKTSACLPPGHMEVLEFQVRGDIGLPVDTGSLSLIIQHTRPTILIPEYEEIIVDSTKGFVDILHLNYTDPGDCVQFFCFVKCANDARAVFRLEDENLLRADVRSLSFFFIYELIVTCSDTSTQTLEGSSSAQLRVKFIPKMAQALVHHPDTTTTMTSTAVPVQFENLNVNVEVKSNVSIGDIVYNLSTSVPDAIIVMPTRSSLFYLDKSKLKTSDCLPAGHMKTLDFIVTSPIHPRGDIGFLNITVKPTRPTFLMPEFVEIFVDPNEDEINIIGVDYADPGDCVEFYCDVPGHRDDFWVEDDILLRASVDGLRFGFIYMLSITCYDSQSQSPEGSSTAELRAVFLHRFPATPMPTTSSVHVGTTAGLHRITTRAADVTIPDAMITLKSSVDIHDTVYTIPGASGDEYLVWATPSRNFHLDSRKGTLTTMACLSPGLNEVHEFHVVDAYGVIELAYILEVTVEPTLPIYTMPDAIEVGVDLRKDVVSVFTIEYEYPGDCVHFRCFVSSFSHPIIQFWVLSDNTVQTSVFGIVFDSLVYEFTVVCSDNGTTIKVQENFFNVQVLFRAISMNMSTKAMNTTTPREGMYTTTTDTTTQAVETTSEDTTKQTVDTTTMTASRTITEVDWTTTTVDTTSQTVNTAAQTEDRTTQAVFTSVTPFPRNTHKSVTNLDVSIVVTSNMNVGDIVYRIEVSFVPFIFSIFMVTSSQYFSLIDHDVVVEACLPVGHTEYLQFERIYATRSTRDRYNALNITVIPTKPDFRVPPIVDVYIENGNIILFDMVLDITEIDLENDGDCVSFLCSISCDAKHFWMSPGTGHQRYVIQTYSDGISFETVYFLDVTCYDAQTLGVMDAFVTKARTVVTFVIKDISTTNAKPTIASTEGFTTSTFEPSTSASDMPFTNSSAFSTASQEPAKYTYVEITSETSTSGTYGHTTSVFTTRTSLETFPSSAFTTPVKDVFVNLDANTTLSSSQNVGDVVYTIETYDPYERIAMTTSSKYFELIGREVVVLACLPAGHSEILQFHIAGGYRKSEGHLSITVTPTFPVINSPLSSAEIIVATQLSGTQATGTLNVTEIEFEDQGSCVSFLCTAICSNYYKMFTVTGTSVSTLKSDIKPNLRYNLHLTCGDGNIHYLADQYIARRKLSVVFIDVTTQIQYATKTPTTSVSTVTQLRFLNSVSIKTSTNHRGIKRDRESTTAAYSYPKMASRLSTITQAFVNLITQGRQSDSSVTTTTSTPNYITTSMFISSSNSHGLTIEKAFLDERSKLVLLTSVCGGVAGLAVLTVLVAVSYKRACRGSASTTLTRDDNTERQNNSAYTLDSSSANSTSRLMGGSALTPVDI